MAISHVIPSPVKFHVLDMALRISFSVRMPRLQLSQGDQITASCGVWRVTILTGI